jgi:hypothetical protein
MRHEDFAASQAFRAVGTKIGTALRDQYDLADPPPQSLIDLLNRLDARVERERTTGRLYAAVNEAIAAVIDLGRNEHVGKRDGNELHARSRESEGLTEQPGEEREALMSTVRTTPENAPL